IRSRGLSEFAHIVAIVGCAVCVLLLFVFGYHPLTSGMYALSLHDALPISTLLECTSTCSRCSIQCVSPSSLWSSGSAASRVALRSEEHTPELQSPCKLVCRLLLEKKNLTGLHVQCHSLSSQRIREFLGVTV